MHSNMVGESAPETPELSSLKKAVKLVVPKQHKNVDFLPLVHHEGVVFFFNQTSAALSG